MATSDKKSQVQARFGAYAQGYVSGATFSQGPDLERLLALAAPQPDWHMLDIATGGGHTALTFSPHLKHVISSDLTPRMLMAAREHIGRQGAANITFSGADAEKLPFAKAAFDLVTCRIAPHHFTHVYRFMTECARVLKSGGLLLLQDHLAPDDKKAAEYRTAFETLRDPSHVRGLNAYEWRGVFLDAGFSIEHTETLTKTHELLPWAQRQGCTPTVIERLQVMLLQAPDAVREHMRPQYAGTPYATFDDIHIIIKGRKINQQT